MPKNAFFYCYFKFFGLLFQIFVYGADNFAEKRDQTTLRESSKINSVDLKKRSTKFSKFFLKICPPPRENPRSAPDCMKSIRSFKSSICIPSSFVQSFLFRPLREKGRNYSVACVFPADPIYLNERSERVICEIILKPYQL